jgi:hypothetical protein
MIFRPEDPRRIASGMEAYLRGKSVTINGVPGVGNITFDPTSGGVL